MSGAKRDCVFLVADRTMAEVFKGFLGREEFHRSLGCEAFDFDPSQDLAAFRYRATPPLREWLLSTGDWPADAAKPPDPKAAVEKVLRHTRIPRSAAVYRRIVSRISVRGCEDPAFHKLVETLCGWFS